MQKKESMNNQTLIVGIAFIALIIFLVYKFGTFEAQVNKPVVNDKNIPKLTEIVATTIGDSPYLGNKEAVKVAIVEYSDYECPYCKKFFEDTFNQIQKEYIDTNKIIFVYRNLPLSFHGEAAVVDANAALCAQGLKDNQAYFQMAHLIYQNSGLNGKGITTENMIKLASSIGLDEAKFKDCLSTNKYKDTIDKDAQDASEAGISGTPGFVVGTLNADGTVEGELVSGAQPINTFKTIINKYLK